MLYHDNCPDGFTAAWAVWKALGDDAEYRAVNYGQPAPMDEVRGRRVILVDFSYPRHTLDALAGVAASVEVYDHHQTAEADLLGWVAGRAVFDMNRSGAGIAWDEFHPGGATWLGLRPALIAHVEDRDLWRWALPGSREIGEFIFSLPRTFAEWDRLAVALETRRDTIVEIGEVLLRAKRVRVEQVCKNAVTLDFDGTRIPVVNTSWDFSEIGEHVAVTAGAVCGGYYFDRADGRRQWGFRSRSDFDVSALCKRYGGGGHRAAAGFTSDIGWLPTVKRGDAASEERER